MKTVHRLFCVFVNSVFLRCRESVSLPEAARQGSQESSEACIREGWAFFYVFSEHLSAKLMGTAEIAAQVPDGSCQPANTIVGTAERFQELGSL